MIRRINGYLYITVETDLVIGENSDLESNILENISPDIKGVIVDVNNTKYIDSSGLSLLLRIRKRLFDKSMTMFVVVDNPKLEKVFRTARIDKIIILVKSAQDIFDEKIDNLEKKETRSFSETKEFRIVIPSDFSYIRVAQEFVLNIVKNLYEYTKTDEYDILMTLEETLSNSIEHGYKEHGLDGKIQLLVLSVHDELIIFIDDYGKGYNRDDILEKVNASIDNPYEVRGRGFMILKGITDDLHYYSLKNKVSSVIIVKKLKFKE